MALKTIVVGPPAAESKGVMLFLHGFPETAASWKGYILHYAAEGYHVLAPDTRNVNNSIGENAALTLELLSDDVLALLKFTGQEKVAKPASIVCWVFMHRNRLETFILKSWCVSLWLLMLSI